MTAVAETADIAVARDAAAQVRELVSEPPGASLRRLREWYGGVEDAVLDLSAALPQGAEDYDARKLFEFLIELRQAIEARGDVELAAVRMRDVVARISRRLEHDALDDPDAAAHAVFATLAGASAGDLSRLLCVSTKTVGTWKAGGPVTRNASRVVLIAQLLTYLRASMTPKGLVMWFDAPRAQLGGRTPLQRLDDDEAAAGHELVSLARGGRGQLAS
jgi:hypothetical protein